jgi:hypothetical protein
MLEPRHRTHIGLATIFMVGLPASGTSAPRETLLDVPHACTKITAEDIRQSGTSSVTDLLKRLPAGTSPPPQTPGVCPKPLKPFDRSILDAHNLERASIGVPPLRWNEELAAHAADYAQVLARTGQLIHSPREGRGAERENLQKGLIGWSPQRMVQDWTKEKVNFVPGTFPDVARDGNWMNVAHYTQMIWPTTTEVGCGQATGGGFNWFVCRYTPGGNKDGKPVGYASATTDYELPSVSNLTEDWAVKGGVSYRAIKYYGGTASPRADDYWEATLGGAYIMNANIKIVGSYVYRTSWSDLWRIDGADLFSIAKNFRYDSPSTGGSPAKAPPTSHQPTFTPADAPYTPQDGTAPPDRM